MEGDMNKILKEITENHLEEITNSHNFFFISKAACCLHLSLYLCNGLSCFVHSCEDGS